MKRSILRTLNHSYSRIECSAYGVSVLRSIPTEMPVGTPHVKPADTTQSVSTKRAESPWNLRFMCTVNVSEICCFVYD